MPCVMSKREGQSGQITDCYAYIYRRSVSVVDLHQLLNDVHRLQVKRGLPALKFRSRDCNPFVLHVHSHARDEIKVF